MTEVATLDLPGLELPAEPPPAPSGRPAPPSARERFLDEIRRALPEGLVLSGKAWESILGAADQYQAAGIEFHARYKRWPGERKWPPR